MACEIFVGDDSIHSHEIKYIESLREDLESLEEEYYILANLRIPSQVDFLVIKRDGIFIIELKDWIGKIIGPLNGNWKILSKNNIEKDMGVNPYHQIQNLYYELSNYLNKNKKKFLPPHVCSQISFKDIKSLIVITPNLEPISEIEEHTKIKVIGYPELKKILTHEKSKSLFLKNDEILRLIKTLNLKKSTKFFLYGKHEFENSKTKYLTSIINDFKSLKKFYVPLELYAYQSEKHYKITKSINLIDELNKHNQLLILGDAGTGKSTLMKMLSYEIAQQFQKNKLNLIPLIIPLHLYDKEKEGLYGLIKDIFNNHQIKIKTKDLEDIFNSQNVFLFIFDGLNEIPAKDSFHAFKEIERFLLGKDRHKFIFVTRDEGNISLLDNPQRIYINDFSQKHIFNYLERIFQDKKASSLNLDRVWHDLSPYLESLPRTPLIAYILGELLLSGINLSSLSKFYLFREFTKEIPLREAKKSEAISSTYLYEIELFLSEIAYKMSEEMQFSISENKFIQFIKHLWFSLKENNRIHSSETEIINCLQNNVFLKQGRNQVYFLHPQFQEFFAALKLAEIYKEEKAIGLEKIADFKWNGVSEFALSIVDNVENLLNYAAMEENYHLIGKCLRGDAGEKAKEVAQKIVEEMLNSSSPEAKMNGIGILKIARNTYYAFKKLLELLSKEEEALIAFFEENGYQVYAPDYKSKLSIKRFINEYLPPDGYELVDLNMFNSFLELEKILSKIIGSNNPELIKIIEDIDNFSISARGITTEILGNIYLKEIESKIFDFIESRLDPSIEPAIEVRASALLNVIYWPDQENPRIKKIYAQQWEKPTATEEFPGFIGLDFKAIKTLNFDDYVIPFWHKEAGEKLQRLNEVEIEDYLKIIEYLIQCYKNPARAKEENEFIKSLKIKINNNRNDKETRSFKIEQLIYPKKYNLKFFHTIINAIASTNSETALNKLLKYSYNDDIHMAFLAIMGLEMMKLNTYFRGKIHPEIEKINKRISIVIEHFFKELELIGVDILLTLSQFDFKNDSPFIKTNEVIKNLLKYPKNRDLIEDILLKALVKDLDTSNIIYEWLAEIGSKKTAEKIESLLKSARLEESEEIKNVLNKLYGKNI